MMDLLKKRWAILSQHKYRCELAHALKLFSLGAEISEGRVKQPVYIKTTVNVNV